MEKKSENLNSEFVNIYSSPSFSNTHKNYVLVMGLFHFQLVLTTRYIITFYHVATAAKAGRIKES